MTAPATAATITVAQVLALLDGAFAPTAEGVANARYVLWIGSGISRGRVDNLKQIVRRVLQHLSAHAAASPEHAMAVNEALDLTSIQQGTRALIDVKQDPADWPNIDDIESQLISKYSAFLDIRVGSRPPDYLFWEAADAAAIFGNSLEPDCEHVCIAILVLEGLMPSIASANWDGLIEAAVTSMGAAPGILAACVCDQDLRDCTARSQLLKFHGCAVRALDNPTIYRPLLVARASQITIWKTSPAHKVMKTELEALATKRHTLMIGLSAQDSNIQDVFNEAGERLTWKWPCVPPAYVFAENAIGASQKNILRCGYREAYDKNHSEVEASALIPAYGKPLLVSLVLHVLTAKLQRYVQRLLGGYLTSPDLEELQKGLEVLRNAVADVADPHSISFVRSIWQHVSSVLSVLQLGRVPSAPVYRPISEGSVDAINHDAGFATSGIAQGAFVLALLGDGQRLGNWSVQVGTGLAPGTSELIVISSRTSRVFMCANGTSFVTLLKNGVVDGNAKDAVVFHASHYTAPSRPRSPKVAPGRTGRPKLREVTVPELLRDVTTISQVRARFRQEAAL